MMRFIPISAPLLALAALSGPAGAATRNFGVQSFEKVRVEGPYAVTLRTGVAPFARATGSQSGIDRLAIEIRGTTLIVRAGLSSAGSGEGAQGPVQIEIGTHELNSASLMGAGSLSIDKAKGLKFDLGVQGAGMAAIGSADVDQLTVNLGGNASARLAGKAKSMKAILRGLSTLDAPGLAVHDADLSGDGPVSVRVNVSNAVKVEGSGAASFALTGQPACTLNLKGSATATGCK